MYFYLFYCKIARFHEIIRCITSKQKNKAPCDWCDEWFKREFQWIITLVCKVFTSSYVSHDMIAVIMVTCTINVIVVLWPRVALQPPRHCVVVQKRRKRPWRSAWRTCSATSAPPHWRGQLRPPPRRPLPSGRTPVSHLLLISATLVATRQLHCETAVSATSDPGQKWKF